jgi:hypothetical protein
MRRFKYRDFNEWAEHEKISDEALLNAAEEIEAGLFEASLGGSLYKKRIARKGQGKRSGYRVIVAFKQDKKLFFLYGFAKNKQANISETQKSLLTELSKFLLTMNDQQIAEWLKKHKLIEVMYEH